MRKHIFGYNGCMGFFISNPANGIKPPKDPRILGIQVDLYTYGRRMLVPPVLTPLQQKPNLEITLVNSKEKIISSTSIIEPVSWNFKITLHNHKNNTLVGGVFQLTTILSDPDLGEIDPSTLPIELPPAAI